MAEMKQLYLSSIAEILLKGQVLVGIFYSRIPRSFGRTFRDYDGGFRVVDDMKWKQTEPVPA